MTNIYHGHVLLTEDNPVVAIDIEEFLIREGAEKVHVTDHAAGALSILETEKIRYAILDIVLGGEKSFSVADQLTKESIPFIFASGLDRASTLENRYPNAGYIEKPYTEKQLLEALSGKLTDR